jgi:hypothetical protein
MTRPKKPDGKLAKWPANWNANATKAVGVFGPARDFPLTTKELAAWLAPRPLRQRGMF